MIFLYPIGESGIIIDLLKIAPKYRKLKYSEDKIINNDLDKHIQAKPSDKRV